MDEHTRIGDAEREAAIDALRHAVGEGRLTLDEFGERGGISVRDPTGNNAIQRIPGAPVPFAG